MLTTIIACLDINDLDDMIVSFLGINTPDQQHTIAWRHEGKVSAFLGTIQIAKTGDNEFLLLMQTGQIDKVLTDDCKHADVDGAAFNESWADDVVIGMLMYIFGNTTLDIAYAVHQAVRFYPTLQYYSTQYLQQLGDRQGLRNIKLEMLPPKSPYVNVLDSSVFFQFSLYRQCSGDKCLLVPVTV